MEAAGMVLQGRGRGWCRISDNFNVFVPTEIAEMFTNYTLSGGYHNKLTGFL